MSELESLHDEVGDDEVHFREDEPRVRSPTPPIPVTTIDMEVIIRGWEEKFEHLSRCLREVQLASEKANSDMFDLNREGRARGNEQERRLEAMHVGLTEFLRKCEPAHLSTTHQVDAPTASTPYMQLTPTGIPARLRPEFEFQPSPVGQDLRAARYRTSGITTTPGVRAPGITTTFGTRASENTTPSGTRAPEIMTTIGTRASENMTPSGTRAPESTSMIRTRAPVNSTTIEIDSTNDPHTRMTGETAVTYSGIHIILE